jgi:hypothetical protein
VGAGAWPADARAWPVVTGAWPVDARAWPVVTGAGPADSSRCRGPGGGGAAGRGGVLGNGALPVAPPTVGCWTGGATFPSLGSVQGP